MQGGINMLKERLKEYTELINDELDKLIKIENCPEKELFESMKYSLMAGGKRLRPALIFEGYRLFKNDYKEVSAFACAMEMVHTFSLIHDDLPAIDNDDLRRGKPTNHKVYGESTAILAGDGLLDYAYKVIASVLQEPKNIENKIRAFKIFADNVFDMIKGEYVDIENEGKEISLDELMYMHDNKTAALIRASLTIGATLAGASCDEINVLREYADIIGLTFQIRDDILGEIGDEKILGKPIGHDKINGKRTFVTVLGMEEAEKQLEEKTNEAINTLVKLADYDTTFLKELAIFIKERNN